MGDGARRSRDASRARRRVSVIGVLGELLITGGVFVLLFLVWQLWFNDLVVGGQLHSESLEQSQDWQGNAPGAATRVRILSFSSSPRPSS